jgi:hypothetical protein
VYLRYDYLETKPHGEALTIISSTPPQIDQLHSFNMCLQENNLHHKCCGHCELIDQHPCSDGPSDKIKSSHMKYTEEIKKCPQFEYRFNYVMRSCTKCRLANGKDEDVHEAKAGDVIPRRHRMSKDRNARSGYVFFSQIDRRDKKNANGFEDFDSHIDDSDNGVEDTGSDVHQPGNRAGETERLVTSSTHVDSTTASSED